MTSRPARRFEPFWNCGAWHVLDTSDHTYATQRFPKKDRDFVRWLADKFNEGNQAVLSQWQKGNTSYLDGLTPKQSAKPSDRDEHGSRRIGYRGIF